METVNEHRCFGGVQGIYEHASMVTGTNMRFAVFVPDHSSTGDLPVLWYLSGLTCTEENVTVKAGAQKFAAEHGLIFVAPDTSPRGAGIAGEDEDYDFGTGAGFYLDATEAPWSKNYQMYSYIVDELQGLLVHHFPADAKRQGITGHSMGGHGALTIGLKNPHLFKSISAFSPICAPTQCPWGHKALGGYLGEDKTLWGFYDATELVKQGKKSGEILIDQGDADDFLQEQLKPELFEAACADMGQPLKLRMQPGYDHSYYFISTFIGDHISFHADRL